MTRGHCPIRMCVICRRFVSKGELTRYVMTSEGRAVKDAEMVCPGRGLYVCSNPQCVEKFGRYGRHGRKRTE